MTLKQISEMIKSVYTAAYINGGDDRAVHLREARMHKHETVQQLN